MTQCSPLLGNSPERCHMRVMALCLHHAIHAFLFTVAGVAVMEDDTKNTQA